MKRELTEEDLELLDELRIVRYCRPSVLKFAEKMETILRHNDYKDGWEICSLDYLESRLHEELKEYKNAVANMKIDEIVDVANFCMMISEYWERE